MNIVIHAIHLNRFFRREMDAHCRNFPVDSRLSDSEMDDIDNLFAGCAFA